MKSLENITKEIGSNTEIMPKDIWQLYGWLFFEPKLLERINTYVAKQESVPAYLRRLVFYNIALCITLWLILGCLTVLTYPNIHLFGEGVEQQPYNFLEKYRTCLINSAWVFILPVYNLRNLLYKLGNSYDIINVLFLFYASSSAIFLANVSPITAFLVSVASFGAHYFSYKEENEYDRTRLTYRHHTLLLLFLFFVAIVSYVLYYNYMVELLKKDIETYALIYIYIYLLFLVYVPFLLFTMIYGRQFFLVYYNYLYYSKKMNFDKHPYLVDDYIFYINDTIDKSVANMYYQKYDEPQIFLDFMAEYRPRALRIIKTMRYAIVARNIEENVFEEHTIRPIVWSGLKKG